MITRIVKMTVQMERTDEFRSILELNSQEVRTFNGCEHLEIFCDKKDRSTIFSYSIWKTERHLNQYLRSEFFRSFWPKLTQFFAAEAQAWTVDNFFDKK